MDIDVTFLDRQYTVNAAISSQLDGAALERLGFDGTPAYEALVQAAMERANERLVAAVKSGASSSN